MTSAHQPLLHREMVVLRAPTQVWSGLDGELGSSPIHGAYFSDLRLLSRLELEVAGCPLEHIATTTDGADAATFSAIVRAFADPLPDPDVRSELARHVTCSGFSDTLIIRSRRGEEIRTDVRVRFTADLAPLDQIKQGHDSSESAPALTVEASEISWGNDAVTVTVIAPGATITRVGAEVELLWHVIIPAAGTVSVGWGLLAADEHAVVHGDHRPLPWAVPAVGGNDRLTRWMSSALADLDALRMTTGADSSRGFIAAGSPWFFTLFGRDSLWTARFMLPLGTGLAHDTLRILAGLQGTEHVPDRAEEPGKIMHELRRGELSVAGSDIYLPPLYYGTVDATALWINVLHDAWKWGLSDSDVEALLPNLEAALGWIRDFADADGDGLLEYVDRSGHGLTNQGWKDSGDSVQWRDGTLAEGPIALCEVQAYAFEAAMGGADMLDHFGRDGAPWRQWAARLRERFHATFWIEHPDGSYPAIALDAAKRPVDTLTSNIGHLLGTGLLDARQSALVAKRLVSPQLDSGFGLRTMSTDSDGYWALSYHGGSVWAHDTAIAISGLSRAGLRNEAATLTRGLLAAASGFGYRMPELHSGDPASSTPIPIPYPAACQPQAWSAAAAVSVLASLLGLDPDARNGVLGVSPATGPLTVTGLRFDGADVAIAVNADGEVTAASGATIEVR